MKGEPTETGEPPLEHAAHQCAGDHHIRVGEPIADFAANTLRLDDSGGPKDSEVLGDVGLGCANVLSEPPNLARAVGEPVKDLEPARARERPEDLSLEDRDLVHAISIDACADAHECRESPPEGLLGTGPAYR
jgi:hypothetical protein